MKILHFIRRNLQKRKKKPRAEQMFSQAQNRYSVERTGDYLDAQLGMAESIEIGEKPILSTGRSFDVCGSDGIYGQ